MAAARSYGRSQPYASASTAKSGTSTGGTSHLLICIERHVFA
jgi:hypothetical protein